MAPKIILTALLVLALSACGGGDNADAPGIESLVLRDNFAEPGETVIVQVTYRVDATETDGRYVSHPFFAVVTLPPGAIYNAGSSLVVFGTGLREPDERGDCPGGRSYLLYRFRAGEFDDSFDFDDFASPIEFGVTVTQFADEGEVAASADIGPYEPCIPHPDEHTREFRVG